MVHDWIAYYLYIIKSIPGFFSCHATFCFMMAECLAGVEIMHIDQIGSGPDLVLLHGWGLNSEVWQPVLPQLTAHYRVHLVDLPGFGHNHDAVLLPADILAWADAIAPFLPERFHVLGWSMGGLIALALARYYPQRVQSLILTASSPYFVKTAHWPGIEPDVLDNFHRGLRQQVHKTVERFLAIQAMGSATVKTDVKHLKQWLAARPEPALWALNIGLELLKDADLRHTLAKIPCPMLGLFGRLDALVPVAAVAQMQALQPAMQVEIFPHASHAPFIAEADDFTARIHQFLQKVSCNR
jgi:pimeloyl-[acyl-carrier protein] methyl ester esterase